jgi:general secretion pathway protein G
MQTTNKKRSSRRGMTLIEIIVVIVILSLLMTLVVVNVVPQLKQANVDKAKLDIANIGNALKIYYAKKNSFPDTGTGLKALVDAQILDKMPVDPWKHEYIYLNEGGKPVVMSYGEDGVQGGQEYDADISSKDTTATKP